PGIDRAADRRDQGADREARGRQGEVGGPKGGAPRPPRCGRRPTERARTGDGGPRRGRGEAAQGKARWPADRAGPRDGRNRDIEGDRTKEAMARVESEIGLLEESRKQYAVEHDDAEWQLKELKSSTKESGKSLEKLQEDFHGKRTEEGRLAKEQADLQTALLS